MKNLVKDIGTGDPQVNKQFDCCTLQMNYTRITWGFTLNCTTNHSTSAGVVMIAVIIAVGTISFYVVTGLRGRRMEKKMFFSTSIVVVTESY